MTNTARGEFAHKIGSLNLDFALTIRASTLLENMKTDKNDADQINQILAEMTQGTAKPMSADQMAALPITLVEFKRIIEGATKATNDAMPAERAVGNSPNRQTRRAAAAKK